MRKLLFLLLCATPVFAQGIPYENYVVAANGPNGSLVPITFANITVCAGVHVEIPCTPAVTLYSDVALTQVITQPLISGPLGNYRFVLPPTHAAVNGDTTSYSVSFTGQGITQANDVIVLGVSGVNAAIKYASGDAVLYVSATGNDSNDGLSMGTAKATLSGAVTTLPNCTPIAGAYGAGSASTFTAPCGAIYLAANPNGYSLSSTLTLNGKLIKIVGLGKLPVGINCTTSPCIFYNNVSPYTAGPDELYPTDGGLYNITLNGNGSASQLGLSVTEASGLVLHDVRFTNFNGTSAICAQYRTTVGGGNPIEELDMNYVVFDNCTNGLWFHGGTQNSFGHNFLNHIQWLLNNGQTGWVLDGTAGVYSSILNGVFNGEDANGAHSATAISISGTAALRGRLDMPIDNGGGLAISLCTGCTSSNFQVYGMIGANPPELVSRDDAPYFNVTASSATNSPCWQLNGVTKWCEYLDGSNNLAFSNSVAAPVFSLTATGIASQTGLQIFNTTTTCTTAGTVGAVCTTGAITLPVAEADTSYRVVCTGKGPTNVPVVSSTANSSATQFTITIAALTAAAATFSSYDCMAGHN